MSKHSARRASRPLSLREELFDYSSITKALAFVALGTTVATGDAAPPTATPTPVPATPESSSKPKPPGSATLFPEVVVTGDSYNPERAYSPKYPEPLLDTPQSISIISRQVMDDQSATSLRDVVRNVPGVTIQAGEGGARPGDNFIIRGFSARTDLYVDGVRDVNGFYRDPYNIEQVEITKGPASVYDGRGSTGGSINIATKMPTTQAFYSGTAGIGTDQYYRGTIDINQPIRFGWGSHGPTGKTEVTPEPPEVPTTAFRINGMWHTNDVAGRNDVNFTRWGVAPSLAFGLGTPTQLTLSYEHLQQNNMPDFGVPWVTATNTALKGYRNQPAPVDFNNYYGLNQRDHEKLRTDEAIAILRHEFNEDAAARYTFHYGRNSRDSIISAPRFISDASTDINREFQGRDEVDTVLTNQLDLNFNVATFGLQHAINVGAEYTHETFQNRLLATPATPLADLYNPNVNAFFDGPVTRTGAINNGDTDTIGAYLFDTIKLGDHWLLSGGVRFDYFEADYDLHDPTGLTTSFNHRDRMVSWRGALTYKPVSFGSIYFAAGTSFNPSAEDFTLTAATADLAPERTTTYELGTKWDVLDKRLSLTASFFYTDKTNSRTPGLTPADPVTVLQGKQQVLGFEFEVKGHITPKWEVIGGYTYLDTQIVKSNTPAEVGNELPGVPKNAVTMWTTYQLPYNFEVGAGIQWVDQRFANLINTRNAGSYYTVDAMLAYKVNENLTVRANIYNLTDEEYIGGLHIQGSFGHFIPGTGRTATLTASLKF